MTDTKQTDPVDVQQKSPNPTGAKLPPVMFILLALIVVAIAIFSLTSSSLDNSTSSEVQIDTDTTNLTNDPPTWYNPNVIYSASKPIPQPSNSSLHESYYNTFRKDITSTWNPEFTKVIQLEKEKFTPEQKLDGVLDSTMPRVLTNTFVTEWDAFTSTDPATKWDLNSKQWRDRIAKEISGVYVGETPYFGPLYRVNRPLIHSHNTTWHNPFSIKKRTSEEFFTKVINSGDRASNELTSEFVYYTGGLATPSLAQDIKINDIIPEDKLDHRDTNVNVWVGEKGVVTHAHIDAHDNIFIQVHGTKKFLFMSPQDADYLHLYPFYHPSFGQAQTFTVNPPNAEYQRKNFPNVNKITVYEVTLNPGDLVYLPPNWFHQVYTLEPSISVNFWTPSKAQVAYDNGIALLNKHVIQYWTDEQRVLAATYLAHFMLNSPTIRQDMKVYRDNDSATLRNVVQKLQDASKKSKNQPFFAPSDSDPMNLIEMVQKRYGKSFEYDEATGGRPKDLGFWGAWVSKNIPYLNSRVKTSQASDSYIPLFFERYLDTRYSSGFKPHPFTNTPEFVLFNQTRLEKMYEGKVKPTFDYDSAPSVTPEELFEICNCAKSLVIPQFTLAEFHAVENNEERSHIFYQSKKFQSLMAPAGGVAAIDYSAVISHEVYVEALINITQQVLREFVQISADQRPIYIANYIENLAFWANSPLAEMVPTNIYCFKHANIPMRV